MQEETITTYILLAILKQVSGLNSGTLTSFGVSKWRVMYAFKGASPLSLLSFGLILAFDTFGPILEMSKGEGRVNKCEGEVVWMSVKELKMDKQ